MVSRPSDPQVAQPFAASAYVINLDDDVERLLKMQQQFAAAGLSFERQRGVVGAAVPAHLADYFLTPAGKIVSNLKPGEVGCYASHLAIHHRICQDQAGPGLVLEDDTVFDPDLGETLATVLRVLPNGWDIVRLTSLPKHSYVPIASIGQNRELVRYLQVPNGAGGYLISRQGASKVLADKRPRRRAIDEDFRVPWETGLSIYGVVPAPVGMPEKFASSINRLGDRGLRPGFGLHKLTEVHKFIDNFYRAGDAIATLGLPVWLRCMKCEIVNEFVRRTAGKAAMADVRRYRVT
jgi:glycosyl transferase, family 25